MRYFVACHVIHAIPVGLPVLVGVVGEQYPPVERDSRGPLGTIHRDRPWGFVDRYATDHYHVEFHCRRRHRDQKVICLAAL